MAKEKLEPLDLGKVQPKQEINLEDLSPEVQERLKIQLMEKDYSSWASFIETKIRKGDITSLEAEIAKVEKSMQECALIMSSATKDIQKIQKPGMERARALDTKKYWRQEHHDADAKYRSLRLQLETLLDTPVRVSLVMDPDITDILTPVAINGVGYSIYWTDEDNQIVQVVPYKAAKVLKESYKVKYRPVKNKNGSVGVKMIKIPPQITMSIATKEDVSKAKMDKKRVQLELGGAVSNEGSI